MIGLVKWSVKLAVLVVDFYGNTRYMIHSDSPFPTLSMPLVQQQGIIQ